MTKFGRDLVASLKDAVAHARGRHSRGRATVIAVPDVKAIRRRLKMSQHGFAKAYRIPLATLKNWEQGRRQPDATSTAYLLVIARRPKDTLEALRA